ncbi:MAG: CocE/NonD family hydrolase [Chloroflexota bacterium]
MFPDNAFDIEIKKDFPFAVGVWDEVWIPLSDGVRLAARIWMPKGANRSPVPAVLEAIPYRIRDGRLLDDSRIHPYFAGHGFASVRVDLRGCGDSEGILEDEYLELEQNDLIEVIHWLATQDWCNGRIGMMGLSWGGFNSLQVAARAPEPLKAIIAVGATVDRYNDDVHYKNGCHLNEHFGWGSSFMAFQTRPPDPLTVGNKWREMWLARLENLPFFPETWLAHPTKDDYWKHGSVSESYKSFKAAVMIISGWGDAYVNAVPRLFENLDPPCYAIAGPWAHQYPHLVTPGPAIDFLGEAVRWWTHWLKGEPTDLDAVPRYRAYCQTGSKPESFADQVSGHWMGINKRPSLHTKTFHLTPVGLQTEPAACDGITIHSPVDTGTCGGELIPHCRGPEVPQEQSPDDARSTIFDSDPLLKPVAIWGDTALTLILTSNAPTGNLIVRLCDVGPDESSERVTLGMINLMHREGNEQAIPVPVGEPMNIKLRLDHVCHQFPVGHKIRLALSTAYWPLVVPEVHNPVLTLNNVGILELPIANVEFDEQACGIKTAVMPPPAQMNTLRQPKNDRRYTQDQTRKHSYFEILDDYGAVEIVENGMINDGIKRESYSIEWGNPLSAQASIHWTQIVARGDWEIRTETKTTLACDAQAFHLTAQVTAYENDQKVWDKQWQTNLPRL